MPIDRKNADNTARLLSAFRLWVDHVRRSPISPPDEIETLKDKAQQLEYDLYQHFRKDHEKMATTSTLTFQRPGSKSRATG